MSWKRTIVPQALPAAVVDLISAEASEKLKRDIMTTRMRYFKIVLAARSHGYGATATPVAPYSSSDLIGSYNNDTSRLPSSDDLHISNNGANITERSRSYNAERRPSSRSKDSKKALSINTKGYDNDREPEQRYTYKDDSLQSPSNNTNNHRQNYFKPMGLRNNYLSGQSPSTTHINTVTPVPINSRNQPLPIHPRESDDLVAMGTNWNPNNTSSSRNGRPGSHSNNNSSVYQVSQSNSGPGPTMGSRRTASKANMTGAHGTMGKTREQEPRYSDPTVGAPPGVIQRIAEIAALESETIRWEKSRKVKKKQS